MEKLACLSPIAITVLEISTNIYMSVAAIFPLPTCAKRMISAYAVWNIIFVVALAARGSRADSALALRIL